MSPSQTPDEPPIYLDPCSVASSVNTHARVTPKPISNEVESPQTNNGRDSSFGHTLEPVLHKICGARLSKVSWFRADWQRGGALTGYATWIDDEQQSREVVVKLPVPPCERHWLVTLQPYENIVPRIYAHGDSLGGYDFAWVIMERLAHGPLGSAWQGCEFDLLAEAIGRFYAAAAEHPLVGEPLQKDWQALYERSRKHVQESSLPHTQRWNKALKKAHRKLKDWIKQWNDRPCEHWCHGDLHLGNAMTRDAPPLGPALLFDFAKVRIGHWLEDAVYFEHLFWSHRKRLDDRKICSMIAHQRKHNGLPVDAHWPDLAQLKRALYAMSTPAQLQHDGNPGHVEAALEVLEIAVG